MDPFGVHLDQPAPGVHRCALTGELDAAAAPLLVETVTTQIATAPQQVLVDLSALRFMDSSGLRALLTIRKRAAEAGVDLVLVPGRGRVADVFMVAGVASLFRFRPAEGDGAD